jgi:predicted amidohydrolase
VSATVPEGLVRAALIQLAVTDEEPVAERVARTLDLVRVVSADADLLVLPELWPVGAFAVDRAKEFAEPLDGPLVTALSEAAAAGGVWLHGGSFPELAPDGRHFNTSVFFGPDGGLRAVYRKIHLFGFDAGETTLMSGGEELVTAPSPLGEAGLATCYDLRFPEMFRGLVDLGAVAFVVPSGWPERRIAHWTLLSRARAVESQAFVLGCNTAGTHAGVPLGGRSIVVDPRGEVVAEAGEGEEVLVAELDPARVAAWREAFPVLADRRL